MFNKKYATGAHFLLKLVAGVGFSDLENFARGANRRTRAPIFCG